MTDNGIEIFVSKRGRGMWIYLNKGRGVFVERDFLEPAQSYSTTVRHGHTPIGPYEALRYFDEIGMSFEDFLERVEKYAGRKPW